MKMEFKILMGGEDSFKSKFAEALKANPNLHMDFIKAFAHTIMLALRLNESDKITIDGFRAGEIPDLKQVTKEEKEEWAKSIEKEFTKKVDN